MFEHNFDIRKTIKICYRTIYFAQKYLFFCFAPQTCGPKYLLLHEKKKKKFEDNWSLTRSEESKTLLDNFNFSKTIYLL